MLIDELKLKKQYLEKIKNKAMANTNQPEGSMSVSLNKGYVNYFYKANKNGKKIYIPKNNIELIKEYAQKEYDNKVIDKCEKEIKIIDKLIGCEEQSLSDIYENIHESKQKFVFPYELTDKMYVDNWLAVEYEGKGFIVGEKEYYTNHNERVRSKSEKIIADTLDRMGIPYRYEYPIFIDEFGQLYPDFTMLNIRKRKEYRLEHFGMMDNMEYANNAIRKIDIYAKAGIFPGQDLLVSFESSLKPLNTKLLEEMLRNFLY